MNISAFKLILTTVLFCSSSFSENIVTVCNNCNNTMAAALNSVPESLQMQITNVLDYDKKTVKSYRVQKFPSVPGEPGETVISLIQTDSLVLERFNAVVDLLDELQESVEDQGELIGSDTGIVSGYDLINHGQNQDALIRWYGDNHFWSGGAAETLNNLAVIFSLGQSIGPISIYIKLMDGSTIVLKYDSLSMSDGIWIVDFSKSKDGMGNPLKIDTSGANLTIGSSGELAHDHVAHAYYVAAWRLGHRTPYSNTGTGSGYVVWCGMNGDKYTCTARKIK